VAAHRLALGQRGVLADAASAIPSFAADVAGHYVVKLVVGDGQLDSGPSQVTTSAWAPNPSRVLDSIGNHTVPLGSTLTLQLSASDPDGDPLVFSALELPLPEGACLDAASGVFTFRPAFHQIGTAS